VGDDEVSGFERLYLVMYGPLVGQLTLLTLSRPAAEDIAQAAPPTDPTAARDRGVEPATGPVTNPRPARRTTKRSASRRVVRTEHVGGQGELDFPG
jgi:hypothetical protein